MRKRKMWKKGFTLIELMTVVIIVGVLAAAAVPIYRGQINRAIWAEGEALCGSVRTAELVYYAEHETYTTDKDEIDIDASKNRYFKEYSLNDGDNPTVTATGEYNGKTYKVTMEIATGKITSRTVE